MRGRILAGVLVCALALAVGAGLSGADPNYAGWVSDPWLPNDLYTVDDTVCCHASWCDTIVPDGDYVMLWTLEVRESSSYDGVRVRFSPASGAATTGWFRIWEGRDRTFDVPPDTIFIKGLSATASDSVRYELFVHQLETN